jgi:glutathione S-transferase
VTDDGTVLLDSTLILEYAERLAPNGKRLSPESAAHYVRAQRIIGLALAACEKTVQIVYETNLRPAEKQHQPWLDRVWEQLRAAYRLIESECDASDGWLFGHRPLQADITAAVACRFTGYMLKSGINPAEHPRLIRLSTRAESLPEFLSTPLD